MARESITNPGRQDQSLSSRADLFEIGIIFILNTKAFSVTSNGRNNILVVMLLAAVCLTEKSPFLFFKHNNLNL